jgi:iron complex transport system substrate-binding protein
LTRIDEISGDVLDLSIRLHRELGPGLMESVYETVLAGKLAPRQIAGPRKLCRPTSAARRGTPLQFRIDLLIDKVVLVEIKSVERLSAAHAKQLLTYLRLTKQPLGLLINFGGATLKEGFKRLVNDYDPSASLRLCANQNPS